MENMTSGIKRKRTDDYSRTKQLVLDELDLELALKDRIANTVQSRITWALLLQESLEKDLNASSDTDFRNVALDTLDAIDTPCALIFERESTYDTDLELDGEVPVLNQSPERSARTYSARNRVAPISQPTHKVLFVRNNTATSVLVARLQCLDCARWDFSTIQGFLNHCRIRHQRNYGGHDECIQHCSVLVPEEEREWVVENGTEISGVGIPSLRRLFEIAVSGKNSSIFPNSHLASSTPPEEPPQITEDTTITHLSRTLGLHKDTPALAPFLGKKVQRRCINVVELDQEVDVDSTASEPRTRWRMPFSHRNYARVGLDDIFEQLSSEVEAPLPERDHVPQNDSIQQNSSRFHISARIIVTDKSRWLSPGNRQSAHPDHTHGWILSIDSPSYSLHVTTILASVTVSSLTDPPPSTLLNPIVITEPPFVVASTTDKPFLAHISLVWNGSQNSPMDIEHWVEIDHMKSGYQVMGEQQVLDIELDRNTEVVPVPPRSDSVKRRSSTIPETLPGSDFLNLSDASVKQPAFHSVLSLLLPRFPMTMRDVRARGSHTTLGQTPYLLVSSPTHFLNLVPGRRKAIEWGRARALHAAYSEYSNTSEEDLLPLTVGDVHSWLEAGHLFPRTKLPAANDARDVISHELTSETHCAYCGFPCRSHMLIEGECLSCAESHSARYNRFPLIDFTQIPECRPSAIGRASTFASSRDIVQSADPKMIVMVRDFAMSLNLPKFEKLPILLNLGESRLPNCSQLSKDEVDEHFAPYAVLSLATTSFVGHLIKRALSSSGSRQHMKNSSAQTHVLTPSHVFRALHHDLFHPSSLSNFAVACALAKFGKPNKSGGM